MQKTFFLPFGLSLVFCLSITSSCTKEIAGCMDEDSKNYNASANIDDGSCQYEGYLVLWFDKATSDFFIADQTTSLNFYLDGVLAGSISTSTYFTIAPDCGQLGTATLTKYLGGEKAKSTVLTAKAQDGFEYGTEELIVVANYCITHRIIAGQKKR